MTSRGRVRTRLRPVISSWPIFLFAIPGILITTAAWASGFLFPGWLPLIPHYPFLLLDPGAEGALESEPSL